MVPWYRSTVPTVWYCGNGTVGKSTAAGVITRRCTRRCPLFHRSHWPDRPTSSDAAVSCPAVFFLESDLRTSVDRGKPINLVIERYRVDREAFAGEPTEHDECLDSSNSKKCASYASARTEHRRGDSNVFLSHAEWVPRAHVDVHSARVGAATRSHCLGRTQCDRCGE